MRMIREWCRHACDRAVLMRGLAYSTVVGTILVAINHGDALLRGDVDARRAIKIGLTVLVPFFVSVLSSVGAIRRMEQTTAGRPG